MELCMYENCMGNIDQSLNECWHETLAGISGYAGTYHSVASVISQDNYINR